jgi:hypothetical protein
MNLRSVKRLLKKYPRGYMWSFNESGNLIATEQSPLALDRDSSDGELSSGIESSNPTTQLESETLKSCFPGVRQVLYAPVYDAATACCICAFFAVSVREVPVFTTDVELAFIRAFLNNVAVVCLRFSFSSNDIPKT